MSVRVGRCIYQKGKRIDPSYGGFTKVLVLTKCSTYGSLSPYVLKDINGSIMENAWQFQKIYSKVPKSIQYYSRWDKRVIWDHCAETHAIIEDNICTPTPEYWIWRNKGLNAKYAIRYPVGYNHRHKCIGHIFNNSGQWELLNYIDARKKIYSPLYIGLVKEEPLFKQLKQRLINGENLLIIEVDGPHQESLSYYKDKYGVTDTFIEQDTMLATPSNINIMLNDSKHPFGHGYCLAMALLDIN